MVVGGLTIQAVATGRLSPTSKNLQCGRTLSLAAILLATTALALALTIALVREVRLRKALQALLRRLLRHWRQHDTTDKTS